MRMVRTTVNIDDRLLAQAKALAAKTGRSLGDVVDDGLRMVLDAARQGRRSGATELPVFGGSGLRPGVDLEDKEALAALLDEPMGNSRAAG